jgi:hypothetical protein
MHFHGMKEHGKEPVLTLMKCGIFGWVWNATWKRAKKKLISDLFH